MKNANAIAQLLENIESRKAGLYGSYFLPTTKEAPGPNEMVFAFCNPLTNGFVHFVTTEGKVFSPNGPGKTHFVGADFEARLEEKGDLSIYIGETSEYTGEETGYLHQLHAMPYSEFLEASAQEAARMDAERQKIADGLEQAKRKQAEWQAWFDAQPADALINTPYGYAVEKRNYKKTIRRGFDGIE